MSATKPVGSILGGLVSGAEGNTLGVVLELFLALAQLGATPAVQEAVATWLKERAGAPSAVVDAAIAKIHEEPEPKVNPNVEGF